MANQCGRIDFLTYGINLWEPYLEVEKSIPKSIQKSIQPRTFLLHKLLILAILHGLDGPSQDQMNEDPVLWCHFSRQPERRNAHRDRMGQLADLPHKILSFEAPVELGLRYWLSHTKAVVLCHEMKTQSVFFQRPLVEPIVALQKGRRQAEALFVFSSCWKNTHVIPDANELFQTRGCRDHILLKSVHSVSKSNLDPRRERWQTDALPQHPCSP